MEVSFNDVSVDDTIVSFNWASEALDSQPQNASVEFDWKDQGWGNQKGNLSLILMSPKGDEEASHNLTPGICPHTWEHITVDLVATALVIEKATAGCWYKLKADIGSGGGFELYVQDFALRLVGSDLKNPELTIGHAFLVAGVSQVKWNSEPLKKKPASGSVQFRWKDQGHGNQRGRVYLKLMEADGKERYSFTLTDGLSPHEWEYVTVELESANPLIDQATVGCMYYLTANEGNGNGHEVHVQDCVMKLAD